MPPAALRGCSLGAAWGGGAIGANANFPAAHAPPCPVVMKVCKHGAAQMSTRKKGPESEGGLFVLLNEIDGATGTLNAFAETVPKETF